MIKQAVLHQQMWGSALTLILASLAIMGSPGPSTISATAVGAAYGSRCGPGKPTSGMTEQQLNDVRAAARTMPQTGA